MKRFLIITISALQAVAMMSRKSFRTSVAEAKKRETSTSDVPRPTAEPDVPSQVDDPLPRVVDFVEARKRILEKRSLSLGVLRE
jgi:hypothetical protein